MGRAGLQVKTFFSKFLIVWGSSSYCEDKVELQRCSGERHLVGDPFHHVRVVGRERPHRGHCGAVTDVQRNGWAVPAAGSHPAPPMGRMVPEELGEK